MPRYQLKNGQVVAHRLAPNPDSQKDIINWAQGYCTWGPRDTLYVHTPNGQQVAYVGDYILQHESNVFEVMDADSFNETYDLT